MSRASPLVNAPEWTVSELSGAMRRTLEDAFGYVRLRAEISGYRGPHSSGHAYFCLKDEGARIDAVIWRGTFSRLKTKPQEGLEVVVQGRITTYPGKSAYQIIVDALEPAGIGALMAVLEERRRRLAAEGLFDEARKRRLPFLPRAIGVVTSPTGAVIRDILHRLGDRFPCAVLVWPVRVQGESSAEEVAAAIEGFNRGAGGFARPDVLIVARGGGSVEELWSFNDEAVVRAAAESAIPLVSAVGHETDWTLLDLVADLRAPTPSAAAEMVVPVRAELTAALGDLARRKAGAAFRLLDRRRADLRAAARALPQPELLLQPKRQRLDLAAARLTPALARNARLHEARLAGAARRLARLSPAGRLAVLRTRLQAVDGRPEEALLRLVAVRRDKLGAVAARGRPAALRGLARESARLQAAAALFASLNYRAVLARGYALVRDAGGGPVRSAAAVAPGAMLAVEFQDGTVQVTAHPSDGALSRPTRRPRKPKGGQGTLFDA